MIKIDLFYLFMIILFAVCCWGVVIFNLWWVSLILFVIAAIIPLISFLYWCFSRIYE